MKALKIRTPALRFPEFDDSWHTCLLGEYLDFKNGFNAEKSHYGSGAKFINVLDIINDSPITHDSIIGRVTMTEAEFKSYEVKFGDILFQRSSETREEVGQSNVYLDKDSTATFGGFVIRGQAKREYHPLFLHYLLKTAAVRKDITSRSGGSTRYNIGQESLEKVRITFPVQAEQQKIAEFLAAVDEKIKQLANKKELLLGYKKGVTQQIFNQTIRFKDDSGNDFADWEPMRGKDLFRSHSNKNHDATLPILAASQESGMVYRDGIGIRIQSTDESISSYKVVEPGDFVISLRSFQGGLEYSRFKGICSPAYTILKPRIKINDDFFRFYFKKEDFIERLSKTVVGIRDGKQISYEAFGGLKLKVPSVTEQTKIADFLIALDKKIELVSQQLEKAKIFKKGLLQQMFV